MEKEFESIESILEKYLPEEELAKVNGILMGRGTSPLEISKAALSISEAHDFEIKAYKFTSRPEELREPRIVRVGLIQHCIVRPTSDPILDQYLAIEAKVEHLIEGAAAMGCNVVCLQEAWTVPFFFCTREKTPWMEFAESAKTGRSIRFIQKMAKKFNMVIVAPILERDEDHGDTIWNTAVVIGNNGNIIGKHRKNHIPRVGDFNESSYYLEGDTGHPVFETAFGRIGINICYGRHHPMNWIGLGLNGAEIVFNPSATVGALSEPMWPIEGRCAAIANSYFVGGVNRIGTETYPREFSSGDGKPAHKDFGHFYGSSYMSAPDASRAPGLSRTRDGLHVSEIDLNLCRQVKDGWMFRTTARYPMYAELLARYTRPDFKAQIVRDPSLDE